MPQGLLDCYCWAEKSSKRIQRERVNPDDTGESKNSNHHQSVNIYIYKQQYVVVTISLGGFVPD